MAGEFMRLGIIGNCQYSALIDEWGAIKWLCWPQFDSSFVFGSLLDEEKGGEFRIGPEKDQGGVQSYIRNTNILKTTFSSDSDSFEVIDFAPRFIQNNRSYKPKMLIRILRPLTGRPRVRVKIQPTRHYGLELPQTMFESNHIEFMGYDCPMRLSTNASLTHIRQNSPFVLNEDCFFVLTYGEPIQGELNQICKVFYEQTKHYWETWVKHCYLPDHYQNEVIRSALVLKLHQFEDTGGIIAATTTSIPEAENTVRTWDYRYCWLRDTMFSLCALQRLNHFEESEKFIHYLHNLVESSRERDFFLQPVFRIDGRPDLSEQCHHHLAGYKNHQPVRVGNQAYEHLQHDAYGEMIVAISPLFLDQKFISDGYRAPCDLVVNLVNQIEKFLYSKDAGLWEFREKAQVHTFTLLMHWMGLQVAERIFYHWGLLDQHRKTQKLKTDIEHFIHDKAFNPALRQFTQAIDSPHFDASLLMLVTSGFLRNHPDKAKALVDDIQSNLAHPSGLLYRYRATDDFGTTDNAFLICSFWQVEALSLTGRMKEAKALFRKLLSLSNPLGLFSEDINPDTGEAWGNFPQTYSHVGLINAAFALTPKKDPLDVSNINQEV